MKRSITTKAGDAGSTRLGSGASVLKDDDHMQALGDLDELTCALGLARVHAPPAIAEAILHLQQELLTVGAELAKVAGRRVDAAMVVALEKRCVALEQTAPNWDGFVLPGNTAAGAHLDLARAVARRCERSVVRLAHEAGGPNPHLLAWMNRLSDLLWLMARDAEHASAGSMG